jgi:hypothetical protein
MSFFCSVFYFSNCPRILFLFFLFKLPRALDICMIWTLLIRVRQLLVSNDDTESDSKT